MSLLNPAPRTTHTITRLHKTAEAEVFQLKQRLQAVIGTILVLVICLVLRLWYLQVHKGYEFAERARDNRVRELRVIAPRGSIIDRMGRPLVATRPSFNVVWTREDAPDPDEVIKRLAPLLKEDISVLLDRIREQSGNPSYVPLRLKEDIDWQTLVSVENNHFNLPGVRVEPVSARDYQYGDLASHLIGYLGEISQIELDKQDPGEYVSGDPIGKQGLEKMLETELRGLPGAAMLEVDAHGFEKKHVATKESVPGNSVQLTIDLDLQKAAEDAMAGQAGAVVATEVNTGRLLVLASAPNLKLAEFIGGISKTSWQAMLDDPFRPLTNKAIQGQYPPASTFKIITALAALNEGVISPETSFHCSGAMHFGNRDFKCWKKGGHGTVNLHRAIAESCDVYFYQLALKMGIDTLAGYAQSLGYGSKTGILLEHEKSGLIPTAAWKLATYKDKWHEGESLSVAIGQGFDLTTPLQVNRMMAAVANGGTLYEPQFVEKLIKSTGEVAQSFTPVVQGKFKGSAGSMALVRDGLVAVVNSPGGTANRAKIPGITVAGKTGTAQMVHRATVENIQGEIPYKYRDHAWFTCYAPAERPQIAVTVLIEHGKHGGSAAAPVARKVLMKYFNIPDEEEEKAKAAKAAAEAGVAVPAGGD
ncbi:MAG: penicillin-binding protein 2 [Desulfobulbaceae bacterium]|nr:penicillin-binding protein 2 [Desulfobulbaceae bacterium]